MVHKEKTTDAILPRLSRKNCVELLTLLYIGIEILYQEFRMCFFTFNISLLVRCISLAEVCMLWGGLVLTAANILFASGWRRGRRVVFLYGICLLDALASYMAAGGFKMAWIQNLLHEITTVVLFYCAVQGISTYLLKRWLRPLYWLSLLLWSMVCCLSLCQFALMIGIDSTRIATFPLLRGYGYYGHRLFGVFYSPEYGSVTSLLILLTGGYFFASSRRGMERIFLVLCNIPPLLYLVLSRCRNAQLALYLSLSLGTGIVCFKRVSVSTRRGRRWLKAMAAALAVVVCAHLGYIAIQCTAEHIPGLFSDYSGSLAQTVSVQSPSADEGKESLGGGAEEKVGYLDRIDTKGNIDTNRFSIWGDYLSLWKEYGLFGLSSTYDSWYMQAHHPELYICEYIREHDPAVYALGTVYHTHNGYLKTLVSTGYLGFAFLMFFLLGGVKDVWKAFCASDKTRSELLFPLLIVVTGCSSTVFDLELFFIFNTISYLFWLALGILMKQAGETNGVTDAEKVQNAEMQTP